MRGYPLPFDPADPAVKKVGTYKVINGQDIDPIKRSASNASLGSGNNNNSNNNNIVTTNGPNKPNTGYQSDGEGYRKENNRFGGEFTDTFFIILPCHVLLIYETSVRLSILSFCQKRFRSLGPEKYSHERSNC